MLCCFRLQLWTKAYAVSSITKTNRPPNIISNGFYLTDECLLSWRCYYESLCFFAAIYSRLQQPKQSCIASFENSSPDLLVKEHNFETFCHNDLVKNTKKQMVSTLNLASAESTQFSLSIPILQLYLKSLKFQNLDFPTITKRPRYWTICEEALGSH